MKIQLYCATIVSIATALMMFPVEKLFIILDAPTTSTMSKLVPIDAATTSIEEGSHVNKVHNQAATVMVLPETTQVAYRNARLSTMVLTNVHVVKHQPDNSSPTPNDGPKSTDDVSTKVDGSSATIQNLVDDITYTRTILQANEELSHILRAFENAWGIDHETGDFVKLSHSMKESSRKCIEESMLHELDAVKESVHTMKNEFSYKSEEQAGVQLLQLFILDLLGRDTDAAKIFQVKVHEDYTSLPIVSMWYKVIAASAICCINGFFLYYSLLRGYQKGTQWQLLFLHACIIQIILEIGFSETLQCLYINYLVPRLMSRSKLDNIRQVLRDCIDHLCKASSSSGKSMFTPLKQQQTMPHVPTIVDAPSYFFVSTQLAKAFPTMMESMMVLSYHSIIPGEVGKKWRNHNQDRTFAEQDNQREEKVPLLSLKKVFIVLNTWLILSMVKFMTSAPVPLQKFTIRFVEPLVLGSLAVVWYYIVYSAIGIALFVVTAVGVAVYVGYRYFFDTTDERRQVSPHGQLEYDHFSLTTTERSMQSTVAANSSNNNSNKHILVPSEETSQDNDIEKSEESSNSEVFSVHESVRRTLPSNSVSLCSMDDYLYELSAESDDLQPDTVEIDGKSDMNSAYAGDSNTL